MMPRRRIIEVVAELDTSLPAAERTPATATAIAQGGAEPQNGSRIPRARPLLRSLRPKQWAKNVLVLAAPGAAGVLTHGDTLGRVGLAFVSSASCRAVPTC
jgi:hypothetical protein